MKLFVYGTLLYDLPNHYRIAGSKFVGRDMITGFTMINLGYFPTLLKTNDSTVVTGEVYEITEETLHSCDHLEGYPDFYTREVVHTINGYDAYVYFASSETEKRLKENEIYEQQIITSGNWREYSQAPTTKTFVIHITTSKNQHCLEVFPVPYDYLIPALVNGNEQNAAGWWYMNKIDSVACTGPYEWSVLPLECYREAGFQYDEPVIANGEDEDDFDNDVSDDSDSGNQVELNDSDLSDDEGEKVDG